MSSEFTPLAGREFYSTSKREFLLSDIREGLSRGAAMANVVSSTARPSNHLESIWNGCARNDKGLFDGEPAAVVQELERRWPNYWDKFPGKNDLTARKAFVGEWCRCHINLGLRGYGKPALRKPVDNNSPDEKIVAIV